MKDHPFFNSVVEGDCLALLTQVPSGSVDMVMTSPPYDGLRTYKGYSFDFENIARELFRVIKPGGVVVWVVADTTVDGSETGTSFRQTLFFKEIGFRLHDTMIYHKINYVPLTHRRYEQAFEYMFVLSKGAPKAFNPVKVACKHAGKKNATHKFFQNANDHATGRANTIAPIAQEKTAPNIFGYIVGHESKEHPAVFPLALAMDQVT